jgi:streptomycin 6-kinase
MSTAHRSPQEWRREVPALVQHFRDVWLLELGEPYEAGAVGYATRATRADGTPVVLKVGFPHRESEHEAEALARWDGDGAVRLLERDDARVAMLLERCEPGTQLSTIDADEALRVLVDLLPRLWKPAAAPFHSLAEEAAHWVEEIPKAWDRGNRPFERRLVDAALDALTSLATTQGEPVLLHQDLHGQNVLAAQREPWLVIDPKPLVGEREFSVASIVRDFDLGHTEQAARRRLDRLTAELDLDRERARLWTIGQTVAWCFDSAYMASHLETVRWLM